MTHLEKLKKRLEILDEKLDKVRTSAFTDGWQSGKHIRKARKWDELAKEKAWVREQIDSYESGSKN